MVESFLFRKIYEKTILIVLFGSNFYCSFGRLGDYKNGKEFLFGVLGS